MAPPGPSATLSIRITENAVLVPVRLTPKAGRNTIDGIKADADGTGRLAVAVTAAPESGKANLALIGLLAKSWKLPKSAISIETGAKARTKMVRLAGDPARILERINKHGDLA